MRVPRKRHPSLDILVERQTRLVPLILAVALTPTAARAQVRTGLPFLQTSPASGSPALRSTPQKTSSAPSAASAPADSKDGAVAGRLPADTTICAVLSKTVNAKKVKPGDAVIAKITMPVVAHGKVAIANGAKVSGHVTMVKVRSRDSAESELGIVFDSVKLKDGTAIAVPLTVQAIGYGGLPLESEDDSRPDSYTPFTPPTAASASTNSNSSPNSNPSGSSVTPRHAPMVPPRVPVGDASRPGETSREIANPMLDVGSKGISGLPGLTLSESANASGASVVRSSHNNVKIDRGSQLVLRVIAGTPTPREHAGSVSPQKLPR